MDRGLLGSIQAVALHTAPAVYWCYNQSGQLGCVGELSAPAQHTPSDIHVRHQPQCKMPRTVRGRGRTTPTRPPQQPEPAIMRSDSYCIGLFCPVCEERYVMHCVVTNAR